MRLDLWVQAGVELSPPDLLDPFLNLLVQVEVNLWRHRGVGDGKDWKSSPSFFCLEQSSLGCGSGCSGLEPVKYWLCPRNEISVFDLNALSFLSFGVFVGVFFVVFFVAVAVVFVFLTLLLKI